MSIPGQPADGAGAITFTAPQAASNPVPVSKLHQNHYTTDAAFDVFDSLLLYASQAELPKAPAHHTLVIVQAAKGLVGLRPTTPSGLLINYALRKCSACIFDPTRRDLLQLDNDKLGLTVSVFDLQQALRGGSNTDATEQLMRLLMVSDNHNFLFDILLDFVASYKKIAELLPIVHYAQRAVDFVGRGNMNDFLLLANEMAVAAATGGANPKLNASPIAPWESLPLLGAANLQLLTLVAHATQIEADKHVKHRAIMQRIAKQLGQELSDAKPLEIVDAGAGTVATLIEYATQGNLAGACAVSVALGQAGKREWLLDTLETLGTDALTDDLIVWADSLRMLYRTAQPDKFRLLGQLAGRHLTRLLDGV